MINTVKNLVPHITQRVKNAWHKYAHNKHNLYCIACHLSKNIIICIMMNMISKRQQTCAQKYLNQAFDQ